MIHSGEASSGLPSVFCAVSLVASASYPLRNHTFSESSGIYGHFGSDLSALDFPFPYYKVLRGFFLLPYGVTTASVCLLSCTAMDILFLDFADFALVWF